MNISINEFRQILEDHIAELRQSQDDYNQMCDEKETEIKRLELRLEATQDAFKEFKDKAKELAPSNMEPVLEQAYNNLLDGLAGY